MDGQWFGELRGPQNDAYVTLDLDDCGSHYEGSAFYFEKDVQLPGTFGRVRTPDKNTIQRLTVAIEPLDRHGHRIDLQQLQAIFPGTLHSNTATITLNQLGDFLDVTFVTGPPANTMGGGRLTRARQDVPSAVVAETGVSSWSDFKNHVSTLRPRQHLFRGQPFNKRLRTSFHRTNRSDLVRFIEHDINEFHRSITPLSAHFYDINDIAQIGALYNLMQHHGYPTPFLDWSWSPFIAAFFAFRARRSIDDESVRIFLLDLEGWQKAAPAQGGLTYVQPHLSFVEFLNLGNARAGPQQAVCTATNIDDLEMFVASVEAHAGQTYLRAFDIPVSERAAAMSDLSHMGITAASMFPGLDGVAEALRERLFAS